MADPASIPPAGPAAPEAVSAAAPAQVPALNPEGQPVYIPADRAADAQEAGFRVMSEPEMHAHLAEQRYGGIGGGLAAAALGFSRGATLGGSDLLARGTGALSAEDLAGYQEAHPGLSAGTELLGMAAPVLATGGAAAPEEIAARAALRAGEAGAGQLAGRALLGGAAEAAAPRGLGLAGRLAGLAEATPAGMLGRAGEAVQGAVTEGLGGGVAAKFAGGASRAALEGATYQAGENLSEDVLHNKPLTAESLLAGTGRAAWLAATLGGSVEGAIGLGQKYLPRAFERASASLSALAEKVKPAEFDEAAVVRPGVAVPAGPREVPGLPTREAPIAPAPHPVPDAAAAERDLREKLKRAVSDQDEHLKEYLRDHQSIKVRDLLGGADPSLTGAAGDRAIAQARATLDALPAHDPLTRAARETIDLAEGKVDGAKDAAGVFLGLLRGQRDLAALGEPFAEVAQAWRQSLEDGGVWGKEAAGLQQQTDALLDRYGSAREALRQQFGREGAAGLAIDGRRVGEYLEARAKNLPMADDAQKALADYLGASKDLLTHLDRNAYQGLPTVSARTTGLQAFLDSTNEAEREAVAHLTGAHAAEAQNAAELAAHKEALAAHKAQVAQDVTARSAAVQSAQKEYKKAVKAGEAESLVLHRDEMDRAKAAFRETQGQQHGLKEIVLSHLPVVGPIYRHTRDAEVVYKLVKKTVETTARIAAGIRDGVAGKAPATVAETSVRKEGESLKDAFLRHAGALAAAHSAPAATLTALQAATPTLSRFAPKVAQGLHDRGLSAVAYLASRLPKDPTPPGLIRGPRVPVSDAEMRRFEGRVRAVNHPLSAVADFQRGQLTADAVDALAQVYPEHLALMRQEAHAALTELQQTQERIPAKTAWQLSVLLGQPVTYAQTPEAQGVLQAAAAAPAPKQGEMGGPSGNPAAGALKVAQSASTRQPLGGRSG